MIAAAKGKTRLAAIEAIQDINEAMVANTPVITGFLRGSWFAQIGSMPTGIAGSGSWTMGAWGWYARR